MPVTVADVAVTGAFIVVAAVAVTVVVVLPSM
jgi:hypothetical protein